MSPRSPRVLLSTKGGQMAEVATADVTVAPIDEMDPIHGGVARRARATLGVTAWGMQVLTLPPNWEDYPNHNHDTDAFDPGQEEVYTAQPGSQPSRYRVGLRWSTRA